MPTGRVTQVRDIPITTELTVAASAGASSIEVADVSIFNWDGGTLLLGQQLPTDTPNIFLQLAGDTGAAPPGMESHAYTVLAGVTTSQEVDIDDEVDPDGGTVTLVGSTLAASWPAGTVVSLSPVTFERQAWVVSDEGEEELAVNIPTSLINSVPTGIRNPATADILEFDQVDQELAASDVLGDIPGLDGAALVDDSVTEDSIDSVSADVITGSITAGQIGSVNAGVITGTITAGQIGTITAGQITGSISAGQIGSVNAATITVGLLSSTQIGSVNASTITVGTISSTQIGSVNAGSITVGTLSASQIGSVNASAITGSITSAQIGSVAASTITGSITSGQIGSVNAAAITGGITSGQITSVAAASITGSITSGQIGSVSAGVITGTITAGQIATLNAGQITADGTPLASISANLGSISAGTITGATIRTGSSNPRVQMDSSGIFALNSAGVTTFMVDSATGRITTLAGIGGGNLLLDASFEDSGLVNWQTYDGGTATVTKARDAAGYAGGFGAYGVKATRTASTGYAGVWQQAGTGAGFNLPGKTYTLSAWVKPSVAGTATLLADYNLSGSGYGLQSQDIAVTTALQRIVWTYTVPAGTAAGGSGVYIALKNATSDQYIYIDQAQVEEGYIATSFAPKPDEILPSTVVDGMVADVGASKITGSITATQIGSVNASAITGSITSGQIGSVNASAITGSITSGQIGSVAASTITGSITSGQIGSVAASTITGSITSAQIGSVAATTITGSIASTQIGSINATTITVGLIGDTQIGSLNGAVINAGTITANKMTIGSTANAVADAGFEITGSPDWTLTSAARGTTTPRSGLGCLSVTAVSKQHSNKITTSETDPWYAEVWARRTGGSATTTARIRLRWLNSAGTEISSTSGTTTAMTTSYQVLTVTGTAPAATASLQVTLEVVANDATNVLFDDVLCRARSGGQLIVDGGIIASKLESTLVLSTTIATSSVNPKMTLTSAGLTGTDSGGVTTSTMTAAGAFRTFADEAYIGVDWIGGTPNVAQTYDIMRKEHPTDTIGTIRGSVLVGLGSDGDPGGSTLLIAAPVAGSITSSQVAVSAGSQSATVLDSAGNSGFPGKITASSFGGGGHATSGLTGGSGAVFTTDLGSNAYHFDWNGSLFRIYVDSTQIATFAIGSGLTGSTPKTFVIDHPLDAARHLIHSTLEGPEAGVYYRGTGRLENGKAVVELPDYFEALTIPESRSVQVSPVLGPGQESFTAVAAGEVVDGSFRVRGHGDQRFAWAVFAERRNAPMVVEPLRSAVKVRGEGPYRYVAAHR